MIFIHLHSTAWTITQYINSGSCYDHFHCVLAMELNSRQETVISDISSTNGNCIILGRAGKLFITLTILYQQSELSMTNFTGLNSIKCDSLLYNSCYRKMCSQPSVTDKIPSN